MMKKLREQEPANSKMTNVFASKSLQSIVRGLKRGKVINYELLGDASVRCWMTGYGTVSNYHVNILRSNGLIVRTDKSDLYNGSWKYKR